MGPKLKEDPREWRKFTVTICIAPMVLTSILWLKGVIGLPAAATALALLSLLVLAACLRPGWFRGFYRAGTRMGFRVAQTLGAVALVLVFTLVLTPLGWVLRLLGKDLLGLKAKPEAETYWQPPARKVDLDRMF